MVKKNHNPPKDQGLQKKDTPQIENPKLTTPLATSFDITNALFQMKILVPLLEI